MSFRGRPFRGYFPLRGRGQWNWPGGPTDGAQWNNTPPSANEGAAPEEEEEWDGEEEGAGGAGSQWENSQNSVRGQEWPRGGNFRGRGPLRGRGNFHSFQKNSGDPNAPYPPTLTPHDILSWLDFQPPFAIQRVMFHCQWLLHQYGFPNQFEETGEEEDEEENLEEGPSGSWYSDVSQGHQVEPNNFVHRGRGKRPGFGFPSGGQQHWTPAGWVTKDNSHKITTKMKPLPEQEIIPPFSNTYPDAANDKEKLKMLINNHSMMSQELTKICSSFKIATLNKEDLSIYPEDQQEKLKTAINCVNNAQKTLDEYKEFLKNDKYKVWNAEQKAAYEEKVKSMIGETPQGIPYKKPKVSEDATNEDKDNDEKDT